MSPERSERHRSIVDTQPIPVGDPPVPPGPRRRRRALFTWAGGIVAVLIIAGAVVSYLRVRPVPVTPEDEEQAQQDVPPTLQPYYDRAQAGDVNAMRMLGTMYYNGLNVQQDTRKGIRWYRKAAAAGSVAAQKDLEQLGLPPEQPQ